MWQAKKVMKKEQKGSKNETIFRTDDNKNNNKLF